MKNTYQRRLQPTGKKLLRPSIYFSTFYIICKKTILSIRITIINFNVSYVIHKMKKIYIFLKLSVYQLCKFHIIYHYERKLWKHNNFKHLLPMKHKTSIKLLITIQINFSCLERNNCCLANYLKKTTSNFFFGQDWFYKIANLDFVAEL